MHKFFVSRTLSYGFRHPKMYITLRPFGASPLERVRGVLRLWKIEVQGAEATGSDTPLAPRQLAQLAGDVCAADALHSM